MAQFKAFRIHQNNGQIQSGFEMIDLDDLCDGEIVIEAVYSGINYKDALAATGKGRILKQFPLVGGIDVAGYVKTSVGSRFKTGDAVLVCGEGLSETRDGGFAELVRVPTTSVTALPDSLSLFEAMAIGTAGMTAAIAVDKLIINQQTTDMGPIAVTGATGGVGSFAIDLLGGMGFEVTAITRRGQHSAYLESLGSSQVITTEQIESGNKPLEKAIWGGAVDSVGGSLLSWLTRTVKAYGNIAVVGLAGGVELETTVMPLILRGINLLGIHSVFCPPGYKTRIWQQLAGDWKPQHIDTIVTSEIVFQQLPEVFDAYLNGENVGRTVVKIAQ